MLFLNHNVSDQLIFGKDGLFVADCDGYPGMCRSEQRYR